MRAHASYVLGVPVLVTVEGAVDIRARPWRRFRPEGRVLSIIRVRHSVLLAGRDVELILHVIQARRVRGKQGIRVKKLKKKKKGKG